MNIPRFTYQNRSLLYTVQVHSKSLNKHLNTDDIKHSDLRHSHVIVIQIYVRLSHIVQEEISTSWKQISKGD